MTNIPSTAAIRRTIDRLPIMSGDYVYIELCRILAHALVADEEAAIEEEEEERKAAIEEARHVHAATEARAEFLAEWPNAHVHAEGHLWVVTQDGRSILSLGGGAERPMERQLYDVGPLGITLQVSLGTSPVRHLWTGGISTLCSHGVGNARIVEPNGKACAKCVAAHPSPGST